jgi:hypothetical protein
VGRREGKGGAHARTHVRTIGNDVKRSYAELFWKLSSPSTKINCGDLSTFLELCFYARLLDLDLGFDLIFRFRLEIDEM